MENNGFSTIFFDKNLQNVIIRLINSSDDSVIAGSYNGVDNIITAKRKSLKHEIFHMSSSNGNNNGGIIVYENYEKIGRALNEGITDFLAKDQDHNHKIAYFVEIFVVKILVKNYGKQILKPYFENDGKKFIEQFKEDQQEIQFIINQLDKYSELWINHLNGRTGIIGEIHKIVIELINRLRVFIIKKGVIPDYEFCSDVEQIFEDPLFKSCFMGANSEFKISDNIIIKDDLNLDKKKV